MCLPIPGRSLFAPSSEPNQRVASPDLVINGGVKVSSISLLSMGRFVTERLYEPKDEVLNPCIAGVVAVTYKDLHFGGWISAVSVPTPLSDLTGFVSSKVSGRTSLLSVDLLSLGSRVRPNRSHLVYSCSNGSALVHLLIRETPQA